jgi:hypothetical protein
MWQTFFCCSHSYALSPTSISWLPAGQIGEAKFVLPQERFATTRSNYFMLR